MADDSLPENRFGGDHTYGSESVGRRQAPQQPRGPVRPRPPSLPPPPSPNYAPNQPPPTLRLPVQQTPPQPQWQPPAAPAPKKSKALWLWGGAAATLFVIALVAVLVVSMGSGPSPTSSSSASEPDQTSASAQSSAATTTAAPSAPTQATLPLGTPMYHNTHTMYSGCQSEMQAEAFVSAQIFDTKSGVNLPMPRPTIPSGDEIVEQACTVAIGPGGEQRVVYLVTTKTLSTGLNPETQQTQLFAFDPAQPEPLAVKPFPLPAEDIDWAIHPGTEVFSVTGVSGGYEATVFFHLETLEVASRFEHQPMQDEFVPALNYDGYGVITLNMAANGYGYLSRDLHIMSGKDGSEIGLFRNAEWVVATNHGFLLQHNPDAEGVAAEDLQPGTYYFDMRTRDLTGPIAPPSLGDTWADPSLADHYTYGDRLLLMDLSSDEDAFVTVFDTVTKQTVFDLDAQQIAGLNLEDVFVAGEYVYLVKDSDMPVIDMVTDQTVASDWTLRPVRQLADGWVLVIPGHEGDSHAPYANGICLNNFVTTCNRGSDSTQIGEYLARGPNEGEYVGPWY